MTCQVMPQVAQLHIIDPSQQQLEQRLAALPPHATPVLLCCQHSRGLWPRGELLVILMTAGCKATHMV